MTEFVFTNGLTDWHFDSFDGRREDAEPARWSDKAQQGFERLIAELSFPWSESPSRMVH